MAEFDPFRERRRTEGGDERRSWRILQKILEKEIKRIKKADLDDMRFYPRSYGIIQMMDDN